MLRRSLHIALTLGVCALLFSVVAGAKKQVERPYKAQGHATMVVNMLTGDWAYEEWGESTHTGRYANEGSGYTDPSTGYAAGSGVLTAANGDQLFWNVEQQAGERAVMTITGGTGRFEGATGGFSNTSGTPVVVIDPPTMTITTDYLAVGTITY